MPGSMWRSRLAFQLDGESHRRSAGGSLILGAGLAGDWLCGRSRALLAIPVGAVVAVSLVQSVRDVPGPYLLILFETPMVFVGMLLI